MKISVIVTTVLVAQVSASFFDVFHGAVLTVQNSFGKLLSDVVTDVKETVDCTILAVEHVLSLSHDATTRYYDKCSSGNNNTDAVSEAPQESMVPKVEVTFNLPNNNEEYLQKVIPAEIDARINERLSKVLGNYKPQDNVPSIQNVLAKESEQLAGVSVLVKKELEKLSNEVTTDLKNIEKQRDSQPSVDTILQEIKVLEEREQKTKNTSEAQELHQVIDQVLGKLDVIEATEATENLKLEEILRDLENDSNNSFVGLRHQFEKWKEEEASHLREIKSKMEEHERLSDDNHGSNKRHESNLIQPVSFNTDMNRVDVDPFSSSPKTSNKNTTLVIEVLDNSSSSRSIADGNDMSIIPVGNESSSPQNKSLENDGLSDTKITSSPYSTTTSPIGSGPTAVRSSELSSLFTNQSTTAPNNLTSDDTKLNITDTTLLITEITFVNESIQSVVSMTDISILSTDENNFTQSVIPIQTAEITAIEEATFSVNSKTDSGTKESTDSVAKNETVVAETAVTEITLISQNNNTNDLANSSAVNPLIENTSVNVTGTGEASSILPSYELATTLATFGDIQSTDTMSTNTLPTINVRTSVNKTIILIENSTTTGNVESSTVTTTKVIDAVPDVNKILSTSLPNIENTLIQPIETTTSSSKEESPSKIVHDNNLKDIVITSTSLSIVENTTILQNMQTEETMYWFLTTNNNTTISSDSSPVVENTTVSHIIEPKETTTAPGNKEFLNGSMESITASSFLPIVENTTISDTIEENTKVSSNEESKEAATELITSSKIVNDSYTTVTSAPTLSISTSESETIEAIDTTTVPSSEELFSTATKTPNTGDDDDSNAAVITSTEEMILERIPEENVAESENYETITSTANSLIASSTTSVDVDSDNVSITSTTFPIPEITSVKESIDLETTTPAGNEENLVLTKANNKSTKTNYTENTKNAVVTETIQTVKTNTTSEKGDLSSTFTDSTINEIVTSTAFPSTESISESIISSRNDLGLSNSPSLEANTFSRTTNFPDMNNVMEDTSLTIRESPPVNRERLTANKFNQNNYNTNAAPSNSYDSNAPISFIDRSLQTRQPHMNSEVPNRIPIYGQQALPPIIRGVFNDAQNQADAFAIFDSIDKRLSNSDTPFGPEDDIPIANIPLAPLLPSVPRKHVDPGTINFENRSFLLPSHPTRSLYVDDKGLGNAYRPQGLTTHKPRNANNYKNPSIDYDSFFHTPPRNSEAHQRALKEAQKIIANSKRSERLINNIMKNKSKFNARSIFNG